MQKTRSLYLLKSHTANNSNNNSQSQFYKNKPSQSISQFKQQDSKKQRRIDIPQEELYDEIMNNDFQLPEIGGYAEKKQLLSRLPNTSEIMNKKNSLMNQDIKKIIIEITEYARQLENIIRIKDKEIDRLNFMNSFLTISNQKKEDVIEDCRKTIIGLKDEISSMNAIINQKKAQEQKQRYSHKFSLLYSQMPGITSIQDQKQYQSCMPTQQNMNHIQTLEKQLQQQKQQTQQQAYESSQQQQQQQQLQQFQNENTESLDQQEDIQNKQQYQTENGSETKNLEQKKDSYVMQQSNNLNNSNQNRSKLNLSSLGKSKQSSMGVTKVQFKSYQNHQQNYNIDNNLLSQDTNQNQNELTLQQSNIIRLDMSDEESMRVFQSYMHYRYISNLINNQDRFFDIMQKQSQAQLSFMHENLRKQLSDFKLFFLLIMRLKKIIRAAFHMTSSLVLVEALEKIVQETCACLECDRCTVYVVDEHKQELWSKVASGTSQVLRFSMNKGLAGHVATNKETLNILNAYTDERFNKDIDIKLNYRTKTMLIVPILDEYQRCIGVIQCVNKLTGTHFSKDDEELVYMIADFSRIVLQNAINFDEQHITHNKLRHIIQSGINMISSHNLDDMILQAEQRLKEMMYIDTARIILNDFKGNFIFFNSENEKTTSVQLGIAKLVFTQKSIINLKNFSESLDFNPKVDINTNMPTIAAAIVHPQYDQPLGVIEVINVKGIGELFAKKNKQVIPVHQETIQYFIKQLAAVLANIYKNNNMYQNHIISKTDFMDELFKQENTNISERIKQIEKNMQDSSYNIQNTSYSQQGRKSVCSIPSNAELEQYSENTKKEIANFKQINMQQIEEYNEQDEQTNRNKNKANLKPSNFKV